MKLHPWKSTTCKSFSLMNSSNSGVFQYRLVEGSSKAIIPLFRLTIRAAALTTANMRANLSTCCFILFRVSGLPMTQLKWFIGEAPLHSRDAHIIGLGWWQESRANRRPGYDKMSCFCVTLILSHPPVCGPSLPNTLSSLQHISINLLVYVDCTLLSVGGRPYWAG